jgi:hypothetical protein
MRRRQPIDLPSPMRLGALNWTIFWFRPPDDYMTFADLAHFSPIDRDGSLILKSQHKRRQ